MAAQWVSFSSSSRVESNFDRLIKSLTPRVPVKPIPESYIKDLNAMCKPMGEPLTEYFTFHDLWRSYKKWSANLKEERSFEYSIADYMGSLPTSDCLANLYFELMSPYYRHPLYNTVKNLAKDKPGLWTLINKHRFVPSKLDGCRLILLMMFKIV